MTFSIPTETHPLASRIRDLDMITIFLTNNSVPDCHPFIGLKALARCSNKIADLLLDLKKGKRVLTEEIISKVCELCLKKIIRYESFNHHCDDFWTLLFALVQIFRDPRYLSKATEEGIEDDQRMELERLFRQRLEEVYRRNL